MYGYYHYHYCYYYCYYYCNHNNNNNNNDNTDYYSRFPKFHHVLLGRDPGTLKSDIVSKKHPQLICSDLRLSI